MKRNLILSLLACGAGAMLCATAQAQTPAPAVTGPTSTGDADGPHHHGGGLLQHLTYQLGLSGSQQAEIAPILEEAKPQMKAIHEEAKAKVDALVDSVSAKITPLLSADQQTKFAELVEKFKSGPGPGGKQFGRHGGPGEHGGPGGHGGGKFSTDEQLKRLTAALGLSADQQSQIKPILEAAHTQVKAIFANTSLTQQQKVAQFKETMDAAHGQMKGILSTAQQAQLEAMKEKFPHHGHGPGEADAAPSVSGTN